MTYREQGKAFYSDDDRLVAYQLNRDDMVYTTPTDTTNWGGYEEYWYDALGRRVLRRIYQEGEICDISSRRDSYIDRMV